MKIERKSFYLRSLLMLAMGALTACGLAYAAASTGLRLAIDARTGGYAIQAGSQSSPVLAADVAVEVDGHWLRASDYPKHAVAQSQTTGALGEAEEWTVTSSGLEGAPELVYRIRAYRDVPYGEIQAIVHNTTSKIVHVEALRLVDATAQSANAGNLLNLGGPAAEDRVLSAAYSENMPVMEVRDLANAENGMQFGTRTQLVYDRQSHRSWFIGALTTNRFLTVLRLRIAGEGNQTRIASYQVDSTGTTEVMKTTSLADSPAANVVELSLPVAAGQELPSERLIFSVSDDYHQQLETYGRIIRDLHHARVSAPTAMGWWSWTAYYFGLNQGAALTNAKYLAQNLKKFGYTFFHIDEGYEYARGEYTTTDASLFPKGMKWMEHRVAGMGLVPGIWTAPFEVSHRSQVFKEHPDWLVHDAHGDPIHINYNPKGEDHLYVLDTTNPGAQAYLRKTYSTLANDWGVRYIKLDFMDDSAVEGVYYRPNTTALEAQRIGLKIIRDTVGDKVLLDKDGSPMLNPVGYVDFGRVAQDTGHTFLATREAATAIAARYYMNHNFFENDPDAFTVSTQTIPDQEWHNSTTPLTLDEAKASIALSAVSGGMYEIGDDLPTLARSPERLALVENRDLLDMAKLGRASIPVDLMTFVPEDLQPSIFLLKEDARQSILTIFNWTEKTRSHRIVLTTLGFGGRNRYAISNVLDGGKAVAVCAGAIEVAQPAHSVRVLKIIDENIAAQPPVPKLRHPSQGTAGVSLAFAAGPDDSVVRYRWDFGDGVSADGMDVTHTYTYAGNFMVTLRATGVGSLVGSQSFPLTITGRIPTTFVLKDKKRLEPMGR